MAPRAPTLIAPIYNATGGANPVVITLNQNVPAGDAVIIGFGTSVADATQTCTSVTDSQGNTYTKLGSGGATQGAGAFLCNATVRPLVSGVDTISLTWNVVGSVCNIIIATTSAILPTSAAELFGATSSGSAGTTVSRATGTLGSSNEIVFAVESHANAGGVPSWTAGTSVGTAHTGSTAYTAMAYSIRAATTTFTFSATIGSSNFGIATFGLKGGGLVLIGSSATASAMAGTGALSAISAVAGSSATDPLMSGQGWVAIGGKIVSGLTDGTVAMGANGTLLQRGLIAGSGVTPVMAGSGTLALLNSISGTSVSVSASSGTLLSRGAVAGSSATVSQGVGSLILVGKVTGTAATVSAGSGALISTSVLIGTSVTVSATSGTIWNLAFIFSTAGSRNTSVANGTLKIIGAIFGVSVTVPQTSAPAILKQVSKVTGVSVTSTATFGQFVPLTLVPIPPPGSDIPIPISAQWLNSSLVPQGLIPYNTLTATLYYNAVGTWSMTVPYSDMMWAMIQSGDFIVHVDWKGLFSFGGKCEVPGYDDTVPGTTGGSAGAIGSFITLAGADYKALIANRLAYPAPASAWSAQLATSADAVGPTPLETAIKHYISVNMGSSAIAARRLAFLDIATDNHRGDSIKYSAKFQQGVSLNLMDVIRAMISSAVNPMGVSMTLQPNYRLLFDCYVPRDLTNQAWFSKSLGNLTAVSMTSPDPTVTDALVQGSASFVERIATGMTPWTRIEDFVDQTSETDATLITQAGDGALGGGAAGPTLSVTIADLPFLTFGRDYQLGDMVSVEVRPGVVYQDVISSVSLTVDPAQTPSVQVTPQVGYTSDATGANQSYVAQLSARVRYLEQRLNAASK